MTWAPDVTTLGAERAVIRLSSERGGQYVVVVNRDTSAGGTHLMPVQPSARDLIRAYSATKTIAAVGASPDSGKGGYQNPLYLPKQGYRILPVNPRGGVLFGEHVYPSLGEVDMPIDVVGVFSPPAEAADIAGQAVAAGAKVLWFQPGTASAEAVDLASEAGLIVVSGRCMGATHGALGPGPHEEQTPAEPEDLARPAGEPRTPPPITAADHHLGDLQAPVQLIQYGDYECPFCAMAQPGVADLIRRHGADMVFAFRHFPLVSQHPHAWHAAHAAEASARQGRFWEMHERLLSHQHNLTHEDLLAHATALGLDVEMFARDLEDAQVAERVREDGLGGVHAGVQGTPTFFVNGQKIEGGYREQEIEVALADAGEGHRR